MSIYGNYDSPSVNNLMIVFEKCNPEERKCKSDKEISDWLVFKYIIIL